MSRSEPGLLARWAPAFGLALAASVVFGPAGTVPALLLGRLPRGGRRGALLLATFAMSATRQLPREDQTELTVELGGNVGEYQRVCGGTQSLAYGGGMASLDTEVWPGHRVVADGRVDAGVGWNQEAGDNAPALTSSATLMMGYEHRWGALLPGVAMLDPQRPDQTVFLPAGRVRVGPEDVFYWELHLFPDLRAQRDYVFRSGFVLQAPIRDTPLELGMGLTGAGVDLPMPYGLLRWEHPGSGLGLRVSGGSVVERREWWFVEGAITWRVGLDTTFGVR